MLLTIVMALAASSGSVGPPTSAAAPLAQAAGQHCRWEAPPLFGPRAPVRAPVWTCAASAKPIKCGHYESYLPIWAVGRALPWERRWVTEPCRNEI
jgi:hypothetical protein